MGALSALFTAVGQRMLCLYPPRYVTLRFTAKDGPFQEFYSKRGCVSRMGAWYQKQPLVSDSCCKTGDELVLYL